MYDFLEILQLETSTACNMHCYYCDYHHNPSTVYNYQMPLEFVEKIMIQLKDHKLTRIQPWLAGEPMLETRMPEIIKIIKKYSSAEIVFFTNATVYENRHLLMLADRVDVTLSAATPETFLKVHGAPLYHEAVKTIEWLEQQPRHPPISMRIVVTERNQHEVAQWQQQWSRFHQYHNIASGLLVGGWQPENKLELDGEIQQMARGQYMPGAPCLFWNLCAINVFGDVYQCCKAINHIYGNLHSASLDEIWQKRLANNRDASTCRVCPVRVDKHD